MSDGTDRATTGSASPPNGDGELCLTCGLCCDGTLFSDVAVPVGTSEVRLRQVGASITTDDRGIGSMPQPCIAHQHGACTVYSDRPQVCRRFECKVLRSVRRGTTSMTAANGLIATTKRVAAELRAMLRAELPDCRSDDLASLVNEFDTRYADQLDDPGFRRRHAALLLRHAALQGVLRPKFVARDKGTDGNEPAVDD